MTPIDFAHARQQMSCGNCEGPRHRRSARAGRHGAVPRERFIDQSLRAEAYADRALGIACGQTISQPYIVALMTAGPALRGEKVLEIGTGSGYQTAILAELAREVVSIERTRELSPAPPRCWPNWATKRQAGGGRRHARLARRRPLRSHPRDRRGPRRRSRCRATGPGGILVFPWAAAITRCCRRSTRSVTGSRGRPLSACRFVPLVGEEGWPE